MASPPLPFHVAHYQTLCWQLIHALNLDTQLYCKHLAASKCVLRNIALIQLPSDGFVVLSSRCQVHIGFAACMECQQQNRGHIHTAVRYMKGVKMDALQGLHRDTLIAIITSISIVTTGCHQQEIEK